MPGRHISKSRLGDLIQEQLKFRVCLWENMGDWFEKKSMFSVDTNVIFLQCIIVYYWLWNRNHSFERYFWRTEFLKVSDSNFFKRQKSTFCFEICKIWFDFLKFQIPNFPLSNSDTKWFIKNKMQLWKKSSRLILF